MELHYNPTHNHFTNAIEGAVSQCCAAILEKFRENNLAKIDFAARGVKMNMVFSDGAGSYFEKEIREVGYNDSGNIQIVAAEDWFEEFNEKGCRDDCGIIEPVIGKIYEVVADACDRKEWLDGELDVLD